MTSLRKSQLRDYLLCVVALFTLGIAKAHAQGYSSASSTVPYGLNPALDNDFYEYDGFYYNSDYYTNVEGESIEFEETVTLDIDDDLNLYAYAEAYSDDEEQFTYNGFEIATSLYVTQDGSPFGTSGGDGDSGDASAEVYLTAGPGHTYAANAESSVGYTFGATQGGGEADGYTSWEDLGVLSTSVSTNTTPSPPLVNAINPSYGTIGTSNQPIAFYGYDLLNSSGSLPTYTSSDSSVTFILQSNDPVTGAASTQSTLYGTYSIASSDVPTGALIDLYNDGGVSNDINFTTGYPDASNIVVTPSVWQAGEVTAITITGNNLGTSASAYVVPFDITYTQGSVSSGTISATVTVPSTEAATQALIYVTPGNTGCTGSCYVSSDPGNPSAQGPPAAATISPASGISISGPSTITAGSTTNNQFTVNGNISGGTYLWSVDNSNVTLAGASTSTVTTTSGVNGDANLTITYTPTSGSSITASKAITIIKAGSLTVVHDISTTYTKCGAGLTAKMRTLDYAIMAGETTITAPIQIIENVPATTDTCSGQVPIRTSCVANNTVDPMVTNRFADQLFDCPFPTGDSCSFAFSNQQWQQCNADGSKSTIGTVGPVSVSSTEIEVNGNATQLPDGTIINP